MPATPRPATEWIFDDLGRMPMVRIYDFTSAEFPDGSVGIVFAFTRTPDEPQDGEQRFQMLMPAVLASALIEALTDHVENLRRR